MPKPIDNLVTSLTYTEFERLVRDYVSDLGQPLKDFEVTHNDKIPTADGTYQIDVKATFEALGCDFLVLIECKHYKEPIKREKVQILNDKLRSIGAQKGIIFSTSTFQAGAIQYAEAHGIALIHVIEGRYTYVTKGQEKQDYNPPPWADIPKYVGVFRFNVNETGDRYFESYLSKNYMEDLAFFLFGKTT
ncbi:restriction endonuclease [Chitinophaga agri]|uniref:Restriction endonuclease n=1 Tax=Chitinophaga agri TaxID=2703787 RepID=A0A6B9Z8P7_9BACT|nr:restriction endonuclease [Chitinophaga agri]QHS58377.1 restriction endonuclease [Chitinophaga agri]